MKKKDFVTLVLSTIGGILFALGMCMALLPQWSTMTQGIVIGVIGLAVLLIMVLVRRVIEIVGGDIRVQSEVGTGSVFTVTLNRKMESSAATEKSRAVQQDR